MLPRLLLLAIIFIFYVWTTTAGTFTFRYGDSQSNYYALLADAFLKGQLHLPISPPSGLLGLPDPYDPIANRDFRWQGFHDLSLYKGRLYLYFGPTPALILFLPFKLLTKLNMPVNLAILISTLGTLVFATALLIHLKECYFPKFPNWSFLFSIAVIGLVNLSPFLLRCQGPYDVAISSACMFLTGSIYYFCRAASHTDLDLRMLKLGSVFLGLAVGSRLYFIFAAISILFLIWFTKLRENNKLKDLFKSRAVKALVTPFFICLLVLSVYNYLRFDSFTENGNKYSLTSFLAKFVAPSSIIPNLRSYLLQAPAINPTFPFIHATYWKPSFHLDEGLERIVGLPFGFPFILLLFAGLLASKDTTTEATTFPHFEFKIILAPAIINFILLMSFQYVTMRYIADYMTLLILAACIVWFHLDPKLTHHLKSKRLLRTLAIILATISILNGLAFSITGLNHGLNFQNPKEFQKLESYFKPVSNILSNFL